MRRSWMRRASAVLMVLWMSASLGERAVMDHCPLHDPLAAAAFEMAHHDAHAGHGGHRHHQCCCLEQCAAASFFALPLPITQVPEARTVITAPVPIVARAVPRSRADTRLPFANGPPHALAA
jgi:hypothetical protein